MGEVLDSRARALETQHCLGGENDQGPAGTLVGLAAQQVEVRGRSGGSGDGHVVFGRELQEALNPGRGVVGALALITVGE